MLNDQRLLRLAYSLLFSLPGAVLIRYGDEIGMGENLSLPGRTSVRTPMQWSRGKNGGFSTAKASDHVHPMISKGAYGFHDVNVLDQQRDQNSILNWIEKLITNRKQSPEIGGGKCKLITISGKDVFIHTCELAGVRMLFVHNLSDRSTRIKRADLFIGIEESVFEVFSDRFRMLDAVVVVGGYGYAWMRIEKVKR